MNNIQNYDVAKRIIRKYITLVLIIPIIVLPSAFGKEKKKPTFHQIAPIKVVQEMVPGWNLGNTLEAVPDEGSWNNPPVQPTTFDDIKSAGFKSIRIPVNFYNHIGKEPDFKVDPKFMDRLEQVFDQALQRDLYVIFDAHDYWQMFGELTTQDVAFKINRFEKVWAQIAERFKYKSEKLLFETMNEPSCSIELVNEIDLRILKIIRKSGGFNHKRLVLLPSRNTDTQRIKEMVIPQDKNIVITCHWYTPWWYMNGSQITWGTDEDRRYMNEQFKNLHDTFVAKGIPVILGEYGGGSNAQKYYDWLYLDYFNRTARKYGLLTMLWDNGGSLNRANHTWNDPIVPNIIMSVVSGKTNSFLKMSEVFIKVGEVPRDISIEFEPNGNQLVGLYRGNKSLMKGRDYTVASTTLILKSEFLKKLATTDKLGILATITVRFSSGADNEIRVHQFDTPVANVNEIIIAKGGYQDCTFGIKVNGNGKQVCIRALYADGKPVKELGMINFGDFKTDGGYPDLTEKYSLLNYYG